MINSILQFIIFDSTPVQIKSMESIIKRTYWNCCECYDFSKFFACSHWFYSVPEWV